ncbi:hypothetical protein CY34DRAFT_16830 [Suillus luteus UH-Slu-Lm8-n1]|uniref:Unplaced genomic scaffold CY34scaffold_460, whole genome shotgun sequence n=1 Tax=Suillus luteus UH-Slu-Lm8-n1 TaxID=930992 RepID=A0A0D0A1W5_9AGAM|nr:hypothetical protein CY34DRAFT_16830 [Suillus luteus UH-Slu-Lm8-n1]
MLPPPTPSSSCNVLPEPGNPLDLSSITATMNEIISPASFITSTGTSALTSASRGKHKHSALGAKSIGETSQKKRRTPSASVQAQQEGSAAMTMLAGIVGDLSKTLAQPIDTPPPHLAHQQGPAPHVTQAIDIVRQTPNLTMDDILDMTNFFMKPENEVKAAGYITLADPNLRAGWVERRLMELRCG